MARIYQDGQDEGEIVGACPSHASLLLHIKVLADLFSVCLLMSIDIQVREDLAFILAILRILAILLQTKKKARREAIKNPARTI